MRLFLLTVVLAWLPIANAQTTIDDRAQRIADLLNSYPAVQRGHFGYKFVDVETGELIAAQDSDKFFTPASNTKLYTTALALIRLGPNYTFRTEVRTSGPWRPGQSAVPDIELIGGGDPNLSGRVLPYTVDATDGDPLGSLKQLADQLFQSGIREVDGDVVGDATRYPGDLYPEGWTIDDSTFGYGAPVSSLTLDDNTISVIAHPTSPGELPELEVRPATSHLIFSNQMMTDNSRSLSPHVSRAQGTNEVTLWGAIGVHAPPWGQDLAVADPALFAAEAFKEVLEDRGIVVRGDAVARYRPLNQVPNPVQEIPAAPSGFLVASHTSAPLSQILQVTNKVSQNLHAEMLLREAAFVTHGVGTLEAGLFERKAFLEEIGITHDGTGFSFDDGSGLARQDQTTADSTVALLRYMWQRPERDVWLQSLPIAGVDGTLQHRFQKIAGADRVHAKTGSLSHVNALSGYLQTTQNSWLAFSIMVNSTAGRDADVRSFIDHLCALFLDGQPPQQN